MSEKTPTQRIRTFIEATVLGRLTKDPEMKETKNGKKYARFSVAVNRRFKQGEEWKEETTFIDCIAFGNNAEALVNIAKKGHLVLLKGEIRQHDYETENGEKRRTYRLYVNLNAHALSIFPKGESVGVPEQPEEIEEVDDIEF